MLWYCKYPTLCPWLLNCCLCCCWMKHISCNVRTQYRSARGNHSRHWSPSSLTRTLMFLQGWTIFLHASHSSANIATAFLNTAFKVPPVTFLIPGDPHCSVVRIRLAQSIRKELFSSGPLTSAQIRTPMNWDHIGSHASSSSKIVLTPTRWPWYRGRLKIGISLVLLSGFSSISDSIPKLFPLPAYIPLIGGELVYFWSPSSILLRICLSCLLHFKSNLQHIEIIV